jgi:hypothetical protein
MLFESTLASIPRVVRRRWKAFRAEFYNGAKAYRTLGGNSGALYDDPHDLIALKVLENQDRLSNFMLDYLGMFFTV